MRGSLERIPNSTTLIRAMLAAIDLVSCHVGRLTPYLMLSPTPPPASSWALIPSWRNEKALAHPKLRCGLPIGLEPPLCDLGVRSAALEPASQEKIKQRGKSQSSRCRHMPRVQALIGWSLEVVVGVHLALLPDSAEGGPAPRVTLLLRGSAPLRAEIADPLSPRTCTTNRPTEQAAGRGRQCLRCMCVRCA